MLFGFRKTTLDGHLFRLREVAEESLIDLGPVNLGVDHLIVDNLLLPWGHDFLRVEPQRVEAWMECSSPFPPCLPFPSLGRLSFIKDVIRSNRGYYLEDGDDELFILQCSGTQRAGSGICIIIEPLGQIMLADCVGV